MPVATISAGTIRKPPPMPKKPDNAPVARPQASSFGRFSRLSRTDGSPSPERPFSINPPTTIMTMANNASSFWPSTILPGGAEEGAGHACGCEYGGAAPLHVAGTSVIGEVRGSVRRDRDGAGADCRMRLRHPDEIDEERHGQDRAAASDQPQRKADQRARGEAERTLGQRQHSGRLLISGHCHAARAGEP